MGMRATAIRYSINVWTPKNWFFRCSKNYYVLERYKSRTVSPFPIVLWSTINSPFYYVLFVIITKLCSSHKFWINSFVIFPNTICFCCRQVNLLPSKSFYPPTHQTLKDGSLSGVSQSWWGRSQLWYKLPGFSYS